MPINKKIITVNSQSLHKMIQIGIVVPDKIEQVMILLHGQGGSFKILDDRLPLKEYAEENLLIAIPDMDNGYYIDRDLYCVSDFIVKELISTLESIFALPNNIDLYLAGISMGGFGSLLIGSKYPDLFKKIISISGAFIAKDVAIGNPEVVGSYKDRERIEYYTKIFAPFDTLEESIERNAVAAIICCSKKNSLPEIILCCGNDDPLFKRNIDVISRFDLNCISYDWYVIDGGKHDNKCFDVGLRYAIKKIKEDNGMRSSKE